MKSIHLLLASALLLTACSTDITEEGTPAPVNNSYSATATGESTVAFPEPDKSDYLTAQLPARSLCAIMQKFDATKALTMGETVITEAQMAEIKQFVDKNLAASTQYNTYRNIFDWICKNMTYASDGNAYLDPYDVFINKRCVCQGYANLLKTMCITQGIPAVVVNGMLSTIGGHAWNYVYADGKWIVSDPTNNSEYDMENVSTYASTLIPHRIDLNVFSDDQFEYNFQNCHVNVSRVKPTNASFVVVPYSVEGVRITSFHPTEVLPEGVKQVYFGSNIETMGSETTDLARLMPNLEEAIVDPQNVSLSSLSGVVYEGKDGTWPYFVPAGIRRIELRAMEVMDKNTLSWLDNLEEVVVADGTKRIEAYAIEACKNLKRVYVPESVTYIDNDAFYNCGTDVQIIRGGINSGIHEVKVN